MKAHNKRDTSKDKRRNNKFTAHQVLNLLWAIRLNDKFYFDTYGKEWLKEYAKQNKQP